MESALKHDGRPEHEFKASLRKNFTELSTAGLDANCAAAYALKLTARTAARADVSALLASPAPGANFVERIVPNTSSRELPGDASMDADTEQELLLLFASADSLYLSLLLNLPAAQACTREGDAGQPAQAERCSNSQTATQHSAAPATDSAHTSADAQRILDSASSCTSCSSVPLVDINGIARLYAAVFPSGRSSPPSGAVTARIAALVQDQLPKSLTWSPAPAQAAVLAALLLLPHMGEVSSHDTLFEPFVHLFAAHRAVCGDALRDLFAVAAPAALATAVYHVQQFITLRLYCQQALDTAVAAAAELLAVLHAANAASAAPISHEQFYNDVLNSREFDLKQDFRRASARAATPRGGGAAGRQLFSFCRFPFMYGPAAKAQILKLDSRLAMSDGMMSAMFDPRAGGPFLKLAVRRGPELVRDALTRIRAAMSNDALRKPLKVTFVGEDGVDEGGLSREFFQLVVRECFSPNYGMFEAVQGAGTFWFRASALSDLSAELELIGVVMGLAIFNAHVLQLSFAAAVFKLLLGEPLGLADLRDVAPDVHHSLNELLRYPAPRVEEDMCLTFQVTHELDFCAQPHDLVPGGADVPVTGANRGEFVRAYVRFLLEERIAPQAAAFRAGFRRVCDSDVLHMFNGAELERVVCGSPQIDLQELQRVARYDGGYDEATPAVRWFWETVLAYDEPRKRQLLQFVTGCERAPAGGLEALSPPFQIVKNGGQSARLPTSHTCVNAFMLPEYSSRECLAERLGVALQNAQGFGLA